MLPMTFSFYPPIVHARSDYSLALTMMYLHSSSSVYQRLHIILRFPVSAVVPKPLFSVLVRFVPEPIPMYLCFYAGRLFLLLQPECCFAIPAIHYVVQHNRLASSIDVQSKRAVGLPLHKIRFFPTLQLNQQVGYSTFMF